MNPPSTRIEAVKAITGDLRFPRSSSVELAELAGDWLGERYVRSASTANTYATALSTYLTWCSAHEVDPLLVRRQQASRFVRWLGEARSQHTGRVRSPSAVNTMLTACARWLEYAVEAEARPEGGRNPFVAVERPVVARLPRSVRLRKDDVSRLILAAREDHVLGGVLGKLVVGTLAVVGLRPTDLCRLDLGDLADDGAGGYELRVTAKRGNQLTRWMPPVVASDAYAYLQRARIAPEDADEDGQPLLVHPRLYRRLNRDDVLALVKRSAVRADLPIGTRLTARDFRRFFITMSRSAGAELEDRQRAAGHASARTTGLYDGTEWSRERDPAIRLAGLFEDYPSEELARPLAHATVSQPRQASKYMCDCTPQWRNARVWLGPAGIDEFARIEITEASPDPGTTALDRPVCPVCHAIYLGPFRVVAIPGDQDQQLMELCRKSLAEAALYPAAVERRRERDSSD